MAGQMSLSALQPHYSRSEPRLSSKGSTEAGFASGSFIVGCWSWQPGYWPFEPSCLAGSGTESWAASSLKDARQSRASA